MFQGDFFADIPVYEGIESGPIVPAELLHAALSEMDISLSPRQILLSVVCGCGGVGESVRLSGGFEIVVIVELLVECVSLAERIITVVVDERILGSGRCHEQIEI